MYEEPVAERLESRLAYRGKRAPGIGHGTTIGP